MQPVLVVESQCIDVAALRERLRVQDFLVLVCGPLAAMHALHAMQFRMVVVSAGREEEAGYDALFSAMRLIAPATTLLRVRSGAGRDHRLERCPLENPAGWPAALAQG